MGAPEKATAKKYEMRRSGEGKRVSIGILALTTILYEICKPKSDKDRRMISYLICLMDKEFSRQLVPGNTSRTSRQNPGFTARLRLKKPFPSKSCLHAAAKRLAEKAEDSDGSDPGTGRE